jgi:hypothetical protein
MKGKTSMPLVKKSFLSSHCKKDLYFTELLFPAGGLLGGTQQSQVQALFFLRSAGNSQEKQCNEYFYFHSFYYIIYIY